MDRLLCSFPVLEGELPSLLARIAQGERVDVSGLEVRLETVLDDDDMGMEGEKGGGRWNELALSTPSQGEQRGCGLISVEFNRYEQKGCGVLYSVE